MSRGNKGSVINHRMSDANTSHRKSSMRSVKHLHPLLAPNSDRQLVSEANSAIYPCIFCVETRVNAGRSAPGKSCLEEHCGGLVYHTGIKRILDLWRVPLQPTTGLPVPWKKQIQIDASAFLTSRYRGGEVLGSVFAGYVPLDSESPYPIIVYSVTNYRLHFSHLGANV